MNREICMIIALAGLIPGLIFAWIRLKKKNDLYMKQELLQADRHQDQELERRLGNPLYEQPREGESVPDKVHRKNR